MPGYILHLTAARMYLDSIYSDDALCRDPQQQNDFYRKCLAVLNTFVVHLTWEQRTLPEFRATLCHGAVLGALAQIE